MLKLQDEESEFSSPNLSSEGSITNCNNKGNVHFLKLKNQGPKEIEKKTSIKLENLPDNHIADIQIMSATELSKKYSQSYSSWKNMKQRCKKGYVLAPEFELFKSFLTHMGPCPSKNFTLDRVDYKNLNYSPDNCRWADKYTQNQNKGNNVHLTFKGETLTVSAWAAKTNQKSDTLYHRKKNGWTDGEIITGIRLSNIQGASIWPQGYENLWQKKYLQERKSNDECKWMFLLRISIRMKNFLNIRIENDFNPNDEDNPERLLPEVEIKKFEFIEANISRAILALEKKHNIKITDVTRILSYKDLEYE